jgi:hypothetical protein
VISQKLNNHLTENSLSPPFTNRQKIVSDTDGDQIVDKLLHQEEENTNVFSFKQSNQSLSIDIQTFAARYAEGKIGD